MEKIEKTISVSNSVADPGCLSRITDPDFYPSRIPDPTTAPKEEGRIFCFCPTIFCSLKYHKNVNNCFIEQAKKNILAKH
jgi:hypothetical protein